MSFQGLLGGQSRLDLCSTFICINYFSFTHVDSLFGCIVHVCVLCSASVSAGVTVGFVLLAGAIIFLSVCRCFCLILSSHVQLH